MPASPPLTPGRSFCDQRLCGVFHAYDRSRDVREGCQTWTRWGGTRPPLLFQGGVPDPLFQKLNFGSDKNYPNFSLSFIRFWRAVPEIFIFLDLRISGFRPQKLHSEGFLGGLTKNFGALRRLFFLSISYTNMDKVGGVPDHPPPWFPYIPS